MSATVSKKAGVLSDCNPSGPSVPVAENMGKSTSYGRVTGPVALLTLEALEARVVALEIQQRRGPGLDDTLSLAATARAIGKSPTTFAKWLRDAGAFEKHQLAVLVRKDPTGHWVSSPRLIARWKQVVYRSLAEVCR